MVIVTSFLRRIYARKIRKVQRLTLIKKRNANRLLDFNLGLTAQKYQSCQGNLADSNFQLIESNHWRLQK